MVGDSGEMVAVRGLYKRYKDLPVLLNLSFEIPKGGIFGYIGPNGAGKTTTIKIMIGLIHDYQGEVIIEGRSTRKWDAQLCSKIGYLPQNTSMQEWRTVDQALSTFGRLSGMSHTDTDLRIKELLDQLGIIDFRHRKVGKLSGGTLQKVGMAQAMLHRPRLLVLDEPVAGLDPESRVLFKNLFRQLAREGTTVFFSSHILSDIEDIADTIGILGQGRMRYIGSMEALRDQVVRGQVIRLDMVQGLNDTTTLERLPGVSRVNKISDDQYQLVLQPQTDLDEVVDKCIRAMQAEGRRIRGIHQVRPSLEDLYMNYTDTGGMV
ncbi:MAG: ABC transporter ATP-binding protein [Methanomassiliicoccales archaeon]|nr:ABC transporter ATP-binding protein [Methanomassiliicoccales archaeon]TFG55553.1 MAG: ABC transporter ATP-binding protein [Methanomassiliicoccus sp.]